MVEQAFVNDSLIHELVFSKATFWVQVDNIPIRYMTNKVAESICETVGEVHESTDAVNEDGGNFIRVRIALGINLPLCWGRKVSLENGEKQWVSFKYERLPNLCYWCGKMSHKKRSIEVLHNPDSLPNKKCAVAVGDEISTSEVAMISCQPCQSQWVS